jgi:signal transduction histidine kinase
VPSTRIDPYVIGALLELYSEATGYPVGLYETENVLVPAKSAEKFQDYCRKLHDLGFRQQCDGDHKKRGSQATEEGFNICYAGLFNYVLPIKVEGERVATLLCGQTRLKDGISERLSKQHREQTYSHLELSIDQRIELERLYYRITPIDHNEAELPMVDHLWAIQRQFYELLSLNLKLEVEREQFDYSRENIAHEFQIHLQALWADSENLQRAMRVGRSVSKQMAQDAEELLKGVQRLNVLVQNLSLGLGEYEWRQANIGAIVRQSVDLYQTEAKKKWIAFDLKVEEAWFEMSKRHISHMLNNLVHNAVKYSFKGTPTHNRTIAIGGKLLQSFYEFEIENYGIGILPEETGRIFEKGYRGKLTQDESRTGAGLGLAIAKEIVNAHGGSIKVKSYPRGSAYLTCFVVRLPVSQINRRR